MATTLKDRVGINVQGRAVGEILRRIRAADAAGVGTVWLTSGPAQDTLAVFVAAAGQTERVRLGSSIVPAFPRHPVSLLGGVTVVEQLAPGRLRLGVGTSHQVPMRDLLGIPWERPLTHLREYLQVLRPLLHEGRVDFDGEFYRVHFGMSDPPKTPLFISALRPNAWALAGELTEGGIAWLCPPSYLLEIAKPALVKAAEAAGRPAPSAIAHVQAVVTPDRDAARAAVASRIKASGYTSLPNYLEMFATAGFPTEPGGEVSDELVDALTISGSDDQIATRISDLLASGLDELLITQVPLDDAAAEERRLLEILAEM